MYIYEYEKGIKQGIIALQRVGLLLWSSKMINFPVFSP